MPKEESQKQLDSVDFNLQSVLTTKQTNTHKVSLNMTIDTTTNILNSTAGIAFAGKIFERNGLHFPNDKVLSAQEKNIIQTMAGQLVQGRTRYAEVDLFRHDILFKKSLSLEYIYAPETVRLYFERLADTCKEYTLNALNQINLKIFKYYWSLGILF